MPSPGTGGFVKRRNAPRWLAPTLALLLLSCAPRPIEPEPLFVVGPDGWLVSLAGAEHLQKYEAEIASGGYAVLEAGMSLSRVTAILESRGGGYEGPRPRKFAEPFGGEVFTVIYKYEEGGTCRTKQETFLLFDRHDRLVGEEQKSWSICDHI